MAKVYIGISGWSFPGWRGTFYPKGLVQRKELEYASTCLNPDPRIRIGENT